LALRGELSRKGYLHATKSKAWDACAPDTLLHASGGSFTDVAGHLLTYSASDPVLKRGLLGGATPEKHNWFLKRLLQPQQQQQQPQPQPQQVKEEALSALSIAAAALPSSTSAAAAIISRLESHSSSRGGNNALPPESTHLSGVGHA
jgi:hypothetical protein